MSYALTEHKFLVNVTIPSRVSKPPHVEPIGDLYLIPDKDWREDLVKDRKLVLPENLVLCRVNGAILDGSSSSYNIMPMCDCCYMRCADKHNMYCNKCYKSICLSCLGSTCQGHPLTKYTPCYSDGYTCDMCSSVIKPLDFPKSYSNRDCDLDLCVKCAKTPEGKAFISDKNMSLSVTYYDQSGFGSLMDWYCLLQGSDKLEGGMILYNINLDSPNHGKLGCMNIDEYGHVGFFQFPEDYQNINRLHQDLCRFSEMYDVISSENGDGEETFEDIPLKALLRSLNMPTHND